jgi:secreted PhoX family phosphatase
VTVNADGTGTIKKHYCLGRISHELIEVMPDKRSALMGDDATNGGLFLFVADREADLSSGSLYVAKVGAGFSIDPAAAGAPLTWIKLGSATSAEIEALANTLQPTDIMTRVTKDPSDASYTKIHTNGKVEWIKIKSGMDKAAAFLETHRYASYVGASMAFSKMEGTTVNVRDKLAYSALQNMQKSMVRGDASWNEAYGVTVINSEWVPSLTRTLLVGEDIAADALGNTANPDKVGAPDNLKFSEKLRTLFIGEDSGYHVNNFLWAYNIDTQLLSRVMSMPAGAEATGLSVVDDLNGWTYITTNFQHAGDWGSIHSQALQDALDPLLDANYNGRYAAAVGYLTAEATSVKLSRV